MISPDNRPDYVNYLTDSTIFVDFSGRLTDEMAKSLSNDQNTFMTKGQIRRNQFDLTDEQRQELVGLRSRHKVDSESVISKRLRSASKRLSCLRMSKVCLAVVLRVFMLLVERKISRFRAPPIKIYRNYRQGSML